jgi:hypothetical protein
LSATRAEQIYNAYYRLYKERLQKEIDDDYALNGGKDSKLTHRNRYLGVKFKEEPESIQEYVRNNRLKATDRAKQDIKWADEDEITEEEKQRRDRALEYSS